MRIEPFHVEIPQAALDDLAARLAATRWPPEVVDPSWEAGAEQRYLRELVDHWRSGFDWRRVEAELNRFRHLRVLCGGRRIHCVLERGIGPAPMPLVVTHGWPGSFVELLRLIPLLADPASHGGDPADAFDVVVPSLPGFGFSEHSGQPGLNLFAIGELWCELMTALGYQRFAAQGGDFGAGVATALGLRHPERMIGLHLNYLPGSYRPDLGPGSTPLAAAEEEFLASADSWYDDEGGYAHLQRTKPATPAYALNDSPAGLAAWIIEKFQSWSDCGGDLESRFTKDELLTNVMLYWLPAAIGTSMRLYLETRLAPLRFGPGERVAVPCAVARFAKEAPFPPRAWVERGYDLRRWREFPRGGHFAAWEEPELLAQDIREFFRPLRPGG